MKIHFIGIGGIGVSALARYYLENGNEVSGSDLVRSEITDELEKIGVKIDYNKQRISNSKFQKPDLVIYSPAVEQNNHELKFYRDAGIKCQSYPEALGGLTKKYFTIAVAGAHGKSTTTAMLGLVLAKAGLDPTVIVGTKVKEFGPSTSLGAGSNFRMGKSKYLVIEACEYDSSFLHYEPKIIVVTNIDKEHLDYFKTFANVKKAFKNFIDKLPSDEFLVFNKRPSIKQKEARKIKQVLKVPGDHNVFNALNVLQVARILKIPDRITLEALSEFQGTWRRFEESELQISNFKFQIISDYAHHPAEIKATLQAAREKYPKNRIICVFQPHQYQRTYYLFKEFADVFKKAKIEKIILTDIYSVAGRESGEIKKKVDSEKLVKAINKKSVIYKKEKDLKKYLLEILRDKDILIIMGAGSIYNLVEEIKKP